MTNKRVLLLSLFFALFFVRLYLHIFSAAHMALINIRRTGFRKTHVTIGAIVGGLHEG